MPTRRKYRSTGSLISSILTDESSLSSGGITSSKFTEFEHRSGKLVLKKVDFDAGYRLGAVGNLQSCRFAIIAKPISEGVPVADDFDNEKYSKYQQMCFASRFASGSGETATDDIFHTKEILKIVVELGWDIYFSVLNGPGVTAVFAYLVRLFVKYI